jgi:hypothetical protein
MSLRMAPAVGFEPTTKRLTAAGDNSRFERAAGIAAAASEPPGESRAPLRRVERADLRGGQTIIRNFPIRWWALALECGHTAERGVRYRRQTQPRRGWGGLWQSPPLSNVKEAPKRVRCGECR